MKVVFTDLDGTLFDNNSKISDYTRSTIKKLKKEGYVFVVVSGRCFSSLKKPLGQDLDLFDYYITNNGATINSRTELLLDERFSREIVIKLFKLTSNYLEGFNFYFEDKGYSLKQSSIITTSSLKPLVTIYDIPNSVNKVLLIAENSVLVKIRDIVTSLGLNCCFSLDRFLDVMPNNVSKAKGIDFILNMISDVEKVYIFGDYENDIDMLKLNYETVAMCNGIESVKKVAKYISKYPNYQDGVVRFLEGDYE